MSAPVLPPVLHRALHRESHRRCDACSEPELLLSKCRELCVALAKDLEASGLEGRTLTLKLKNTEFDVMSRSHTLGHNISSAEDMNRVAAKLLEVRDIGSISSIREDVMESYMS